MSGFWTDSWWPTPETEKSSACPAPVSVKPSARVSSESESTFWPVWWTSHYKMPHDHDAPLVVGLSLLSVR
ncbi:hypothetical protein ACKKBG_A15265 [Auxenochlorella protothecoides x Auxenochlorella symbiontica]